MLKRNSKIISTVVIVVIYLLALLVSSFIFFRSQYNNPFINVFIADVAATIVVFIFSVIFSNSSIYDPYWSVVPPFIVLLIIYFSPEGNDFRQTVILFLVLLWSVRLTLNWLRSWPGLHHQDWRYVSIAEKTGNWYWPVSFLGIHFMPTVFVFLGCLPLFYSLSSEKLFNIYDIVASLFTLIAILTEWIADEQLLKFRKQNVPGSFIKSGLWAYSRHPNYLGEISFWLGIFLFVISSSNLKNFVGNWTIIGFISMVILFKFISIPLMEKRNMERKPGYKEYMKQVPALFPGVRKRN